MQGMTVLMFAIEAKMEALIYKLIEMGADIHAKTVCPTPLLPSHLPQVCVGLLTGLCGGQFGPGFGTATVRK